MSATSLADRIQRLEDLEAIRDLTARYAFHVNKGWHGKVVDVDAMPSLFTDDVRYESPDIPELSAVGLERGVQVLKESTAALDFSMHSFTNPILAVDGDQATGNWLMWIASKAGGGARQVFASVDLGYVRQPQGWRIQSVTLRIGMAIAVGMAMAAPHGAGERA